MNKKYDKQRTIHYYRGMFIHSIKFNGQYMFSDSAFPDDGFDTVTIEWTNFPVDAFDLTAHQSDWLWRHGYGQPVILTITLDGMPDEEEPD